MPLPKKRTAAGRPPANTGGTCPRIREGYKVRLDPDQVRQAAGAYQTLPYLLNDMGYVAEAHELAIDVIFDPSGEQLLVPEYMLVVVERRLPPKIFLRRRKPLKETGQ